MSANDAASAERTQDLVEAQRFLDALAGPGQSFVFQWFPDSKACSVPAAHVFSTLDNVDHRLVNLNESGCGIFVTVNESDGGRKKEDITHVRAVFVDLDGSPLQPILDAELKPHIIIESSSGRWHAYWLVTDDFPLNRFRDCQQGLANRFNGDASVCDLPRVLRLPGFTHRKKDPFVTRIHRMENELPRYSSDEILEWACPGGARPASVSQLQLKPAIQAPIAVANHQTRYAVHILKEEAKTVTSAAAGHRNNELNRAAFKLGSYIAAGLLALPEVEKALRDASRAAGLEHAEIQGTLQSGLAAGAQDPINLAELNYQASAFEVVQELNAKHAAVMVGGKFAVMNLEDSDEIFTFSRKTDLFDRHAKDLLPQLMRPSAAKPPTKAQVWWQSPLRRQYNGVIFAPGKPQGANDKFNLWRGFAIAPKAGTSELYWTLVRKGICGDDDEVYSYVRKYLAHMMSLAVGQGELQRLRYQVNVLRRVVAE